MSQRSRALEQRHKSWEPNENNPLARAREDLGSYQSYLKESPPSHITQRHWQFHYFKNKSAKWWMERAEWDTNIKKVVLPDAVKDIVDWKLISEDEAASLTRMIESPDSENLFMAITIIIQHKANIRRLYKLNRYKKKK